MAYVYQLPKDTAANWTSANPTLPQGVLAYETDTGKMKLGDGSTTWNSLDYLLVPSDALTAFPSQTDNAGKFLTTNGSALSWGTVESVALADVITYAIALGG